MMIVYWLNIFSLIIMTDCLLNTFHSPYLTNKEGETLVSWETRYKMEIIWCLEFYTKNQWHRRTSTWQIPCEQPHFLPTSAPFSILKIFKQKWISLKLCILLLRYVVVHTDREFHKINSYRFWAKLWGKSFRMLCK